MDEKAKIELRNSYVEEMENMMNAAKTENRAFTDEENAKFDELEKNIKNIDNMSKKEEVLSNMELKEVKEVENKISVEEQDIKNFANLIRNYSNTGEVQMTKGDNGAVIPSTIARKIIDKIVELSPLVASATRYNAKGTFNIPKVDTTVDDVTVDYATEFSELVEKSNKFATVTLTGFLAGSLVKVSKSLLNNSDFDLVNFVVNRMAQKYAKFLEKECLYGTTSKIDGIVGSYDSTNMKVTLASKTAITSDELIDIQETVPDDYQAKAYWIMNRETRKAIRKLKDGQGNYLLNQVFGKDWDYELLGKPVHCSENAKKLGTVSTPVIFYGDFSGLALKVVEDMEISVLLEKFATQHAVGVCGYAEVDAEVENTQKIAVAVTANA